MLRKELENIIEHEGEECLSEAKFVDDHPIVFWNLVSGYWDYLIFLYYHCSGVIVERRSEKEVISSLQ